MLGKEIVVCKSAAYFAKPLFRALNKTQEVRPYSHSFEQFPDGEFKVRLDDPNWARGRDFIVITTGNPHNVLPNMWELAMLARTLKLNGAQSVEAIVTHLPFCRQERKSKPGECTSTDAVADFLKTVARIDRIIFFDLHVAAIQTLYSVLSIPSMHIRTRFLFENYLRKKALGELSGWSICAPDLGRRQEAKAIAKDLWGEQTDLHLVQIDKERLGPTRTRLKSVEGLVKGRNIAISDDEINTGGTLITASRALKERGAKRVLVLATHGKLVGGAARRLTAEEAIDEVVVSNTVSIPSEKRTSKIKIISLAPILAELINLLADKQNDRPIEPQLEDFMLRSDLEIFGK